MVDRINTNLGGKIMSLIFEYAEVKVSLWYPYKGIGKMVSYKSIPEFPYDTEL